MVYVKRQNAEIYADLLGHSGAIVTLLNGHTRSHKDFRLMSQFLVDHGYRVCLLDHRGSGLTKSQDSFTLQEMLDDIVAVWKHFNIDKNHLLGISMGGVLAQHLAVQHPTMIHKLVLVSTTCSARYFIAPERPWGTTLESVMHKLSLYVSPQFAQRNPVLLRAMAKQILENIELGRFKQMAQAQRQAFTHDDYETEHLLNQIKHPCLIVHGAEDQIISVEATEAFKKHLPQAEVKILPGIGHLILAEASKDFYQIVVGFLNKQN